MYICPAGPLPVPVYSPPPPPAPSLQYFKLVLTSTVRAAEDIYTHICIYIHIYAYIQIYNAAFVLFLFNFQVGFGAAVCVWLGMVYLGWL